MPVGAPATEDLEEDIGGEDIMATPLLERAGLVKPPLQDTKLLPSRSAVANALKASQSAPESADTEQASPPPQARSDSGN